MRKRVLYCEEAPTFSLRRGMVHATDVIGDETYNRVMDVHTLAEAVKRANRVLDQAAEMRPVPIGRLRKI